MGPLLIIVAAPIFDLFFSILQAQKPVLIQALLPKTAVKRFDERIFRGLPRLGEIQDQAMGIGPQVKFFGDGLQTIVRLDGLRHRVAGHRQVESQDHIIALVAVSHPDEGINTAKIIHYR